MFFSYHFSVVDPHGFNADTDTVFFLNPDTDPESQTDPDPDHGQT
jgi:hypothetical protein